MLNLVLLPISIKTSPGRTNGCTDNKMSRNQMKRTLFTIVGLCLLVVAFGSQLLNTPTPTTAKAHCSGYTIVEAGIGVDCHGDTVKLVKTAGFYERAL
jgi:hypothetical protein